MALGNAPSNGSSGFKQARDLYLIAQENSSDRFLLQEKITDRNYNHVWHCLVFLRYLRSATVEVEMTISSTDINGSVVAGHNVVGVFGRMFGPVLRAVGKKCQLRSKFWSTKGEHFRAGLQEERDQRAAEFVAGNEILIEIRATAVAMSLFPDECLGISYGPFSAPRSKKSACKTEKVRFNKSETPSKESALSFDE